MPWVSGHLYPILKETLQQWSDDKAARLGAALAYYAAFSIGPLLVVVIAVAGLIFGQDAVRGEVTAALKALLGDAGARGVEGMLVEAGRPQHGLTATVVSAVTLIVGALGVVIQLKDALNTIWNVAPNPQAGIWRFIQSYVLSLGALLALAFLLLISLVLSAAATAFGGLFVGALGQTLIQVLNLVLSFALVTVLFALMFKFLPDTKVAWRDVWIGAVATATLFTLGRYAIGTYLVGDNMETTFGAAASIAVLLVWVYYSAQIVFLGAEFTQVFALRYGSLKAAAEQRHDGSSS